MLDIRFNTCIMSMLSFDMEIIMKRLLLLSMVASLAACSSTPKFESRTESKEVRTFETTSTSNVKPTAVVDTANGGIPTVPDFEVRALTRTEVIAAVDQCKDNGMSPFVEYLSQKTPYGRVMTPVNVHCNPNRRGNQ